MIPWNNIRNALANRFDLIPSINTSRRIDSIMYAHYASALMTEDDGKQTLDCFQLARFSEVNLAHLRILSTTSVFVGVTYAYAHK